MLVQYIACVYVYVYVHVHVHVCVRVCVCVIVCVLCVFPELRILITNSVMLH